MPYISFPHPIPLPTETHPCNLHSIETYLQHGSGWGYAYTIRLAPPRSSCDANIFVPQAHVISSTQQRFARTGSVPITPDERSCAQATLGDIVGEEAGEGLAVREMRVVYRGLAFQGNCWVPLDENVRTRMDQATAVRSIEGEDGGSGRKMRAVAFRDSWSWVRGRSYAVEVWSLDGETCYEGESTVMRVDLKTQGEAAERKGAKVRSVTLWTVVPDQQTMVLLVGEIRTDMRVGWFEEVRS